MCHNANGKLIERAIDDACLRFGFSDKLLQRQDPDDHTAIHWTCEEAEIDEARRRENGENSKPLIEAASFDSPSENIHGEMCEALADNDS